MKHITDGISKHLTSGAPYVSILGLRLDISNESVSLLGFYYDSIMLIVTF